MDWGRGAVVACWTYRGRGNRLLEVEAVTKFRIRLFFLPAFDKFDRILLNFDRILKIWTRQNLPIFSKFSDHGSSQMHP
jgi:hypothetical protein